MIVTLEFKDLYTNQPLTITIKGKHSMHIEEIMTQIRLMMHELEDLKDEVLFHYIEGR